MRASGGALRDFEAKQARRKVVTIDLGQSLSRASFSLDPELFLLLTAFYAEGFVQARDALADRPKKLAQRFMAQVPENRNRHELLYRTIVPAVGVAKCAGSTIVGVSSCCAKN